MAALPYKWRTAPTSGQTEGVNLVYSDSDTGSDRWGDGTRANPYKTLRRAFIHDGTAPPMIVCRGLFSEMMSDGNHACTICGDYLGAAVFDGAENFVLYGFRHSKMIIMNVAVGSAGLYVASGSALFAGVGSANNASNVGNANNVYGVAGTDTLKRKTMVPRLCRSRHQTGTAENKQNGWLVSRLAENWPVG